MCGLQAEEVLDVGAGSGIFSRQLLDGGICQRAACVDPGYTEERTEFHHGRPIHFLRSVDQVSQHLILMMDVLEHVEDDVGLLRSYVDRMPRGGSVLITVPAFQFLWSGHDIFLEHKRRYTLTALEKVVRASRLKPVYSRYFFCALFPLIAFMRLRDRHRLFGGKIEAKSELKKYSAPVNTILKLIHDIERITLFRFNRVVGLSVFCLARHE